MSLGRRRPGRNAALAAVLAGLAACHSSGSDPAPGGRWIETAPSDELIAAQLRRIDCAEANDFSGSGTGTGRGGSLTFEDVLPLLAPSGNGLTLSGGKGAPRVRLQRSFGPGELDAARFRIAGLRRGKVRLTWFFAGERTPAGSLELDKTQGGGTLHDHYFFDLAGRLPADRPVEFELEPTSVAAEVVTLHELCFGRAALDSERLSLSSKVAWKATLGGETRDVLVQPPAGSISKRLALAGDARLTAGFGRLAGRASAVRLTVRAEGGGEAARLLFDRRIEARELAAGWVDLEVDLASLGAGEARLTLAATAEPEADPEFVAVWSAPRVVTLQPRDRRPNIVLISIDTLRADRLSLYGYGRETSPHLDAWARSRGATVFRQVVAPSGWTLPSHFSLFTGLDAFHHPANFDSLALDPSAFSFLAERLLASGYRTQAFTGGGFLHPNYGLSRGFEQYAFWRTPDDRAAELASTLQRAGRWLDGQVEARQGSAIGGEPFLLFLHTYEVHSPYSARQPYFAKFSPLPEAVVDFESDERSARRGFLGTFHAVARLAPDARDARDAPGALPGEAPPAVSPELLSALYDSKVAYVDEQLAPLLHRLAAPPFADNTIVVLFSDHGESLGEAGRYSHGSLALENLLVPLVVALPGSGAGREIPTQVRLIDLFPTLLELAGAEVPPGIDGQSLRGLLAGGSEPQGRPAWAYAASTNHGLSLLAADGLKLDWRNSVWKPIAGELLWSRRDGFVERALTAGPATPEASRMVRQIQQAYAREASGLRCELRNRSTVPLRIALASDMVYPPGVKSPLVEGAKLDWQGAGRLQLDLAAGATVALQFERAERREVELRLDIRTASCGTPATTAIASRADQLRQPLRRRIEIPACPGEAAGTGAGAGAAVLDLELVWRGSLPGSHGSLRDAALVEDLRALGYLH